jgi:hypothetical protein
MLDTKTFIQNLTPEDVIKIIENLGGELYKEHNNYLIFNSICCQPEKHKLYYYFDSHYFHCYLDTCSRNYSIFDLVAHIKKVNFYDAVNYIESLLNKNVQNQTTQKLVYKIDDFEWINKFKKNDINIFKNSIINESVLNQYINAPYKGWIDEGIGVHTQYKFGIRYDLESNRVVIPKRNINGELIGVAGRTLEKNYKENEIPKYFPLYLYFKSVELYGLWKTKEAIKRKHKVIIFESEKSVMKCEEIYGDDNFAVAVESSSISDEQIKLILQLDVNKILLAFDKEYYSIYSEEYQRYCKHLKELALKFRNYADVYLVLDKWNYLSYKDAPIDKGKEVLEALLNKKEKI